MASIGGNLCQRVRCAYFRDGVVAVQQARAADRVLGARRAATAGTRSSGTSEHCIATHPSDLAVALVAFDAVVHTLGPDGRAHDRRSTTSSCCPATRRSIEHPLEHGELIVADRAAAARRWRAASLYLKFRDRAVLRVRARLRRGGARGPRRRRRRRPPGARRRRHQAVAGAARRSRRSSARRRRRSSSRPRRAASSRPARPRAHNAFKVELAAARDRARARPTR